MKPCPYCGATPCNRSECSDKHRLVTDCQKYTREGFPKRKREPQPEAERVRKQVCTRILPDLARRIRAEAARQGLSLAEYWERHALTLPPA